MHEIALDLLILLGGVWLVAVTLRPLGLPTIMGELIVGVVLGPAVLGWIQPGELIQLLAEIGIFFLMFHAGVETQPLEFYQALKFQKVPTAMIRFNEEFHGTTSKPSNALRTILYLHHWFDKFSKKED